MRGSLVALGLIICRIGDPAWQRHIGASGTNIIGCRGNRKTMKRAMADLQMFPASRALVWCARRFRSSLQVDYFRIMLAFTLVHGIKYIS